MREEWEVQRLFQELRRRDEDTAPAFREVVTRARRIRSGPSTRRLAFGAAVFVALAAAAILLIRRPAFERRPRVSVMISEWRSPTASLLRTPGFELLDSVPSIGGPAPVFSRIEEGGPQATPLHRKEMPQTDDGRSSR
jgi:hypothetical protein